MECKFCLETETDANTLISPCCCIGSMQHVHINCLNNWLLSNKGTDNYERCKDCNCRYKRDEPENIDNVVNNKLTMVSLSCVTGISSILILFIAGSGLSIIFCNIILLIIYIFSVTYFSLHNNSIGIWLSIILLFLAFYNGRKVKTFIVDLWLIFMYAIAGYHFIDEGWDIVSRIIKKDSLVKSRVGMYDRFTNNFVFGII